MKLFNSILNNLKLFKQCLSSQDKLQHELLIYKVNILILNKKDNKQLFDLINNINVIILELINSKKPYDKDQLSNFSHCLVTTISNIEEYIGITERQKIESKYEKEYEKYKNKYTNNLHYLNLTNSKFIEILLTLS